MNSDTTLQRLVATHAYAKGLGEKIHEFVPQEELQRLLESLEAYMRTVPRHHAGPVVDLFNSGLIDGLKRGIPQAKPGREVS